MELNLPILDQLASCRNLLIAGMGGGFDLFCGLPIFFELQRRGQTVHLASFSFSDIKSCSHGTRLTNTLVGVTADYTGLVFYFPELYLAQWFQEKRNEAVTIWCFHKTGTRPLLENYRVLVEHLSIDGILLIDGGVDSLWISPLMPLYWFFDLPLVAQHNLYLSQLRDTDTFMDTVRVYRWFAGLIPKRPAATIPLR